MTIIQILLGLIGLGIVVFVHELGHLLAAKAVGIEVEAFSLGWGPRLAGFTWRDTEYRVSVFPIGGYCKMKGERSYVEALESNSDQIDAEPGSFYAATPWKRIVTLLAGPVANVVFAVIAVSIIFWAGFTQETWQNRIVLASEYTESPQPSAADIGGLQTGDVIHRIGDREIRTWDDLQYEIGRNALRTLDVEIERNGTRLVIPVTPELSQEQSRGLLGVFAWVEPVVRAAEGEAASAGFQQGDTIVQIGDTEVEHALDFTLALSQSTGPLSVVVLRGGSTAEVVIPESASAIASSLLFETLLMPSPDYGLVEAFGRGVRTSFRYLTDSVDALRLLVQGVRLRNAVAGPVQITSTIGRIAINGFRTDFATGMKSVFDFLSFLSMVLFFMNLLPIPVLDGGQIVLSVVEWVRGRGTRPKSMYRYQLVGSVMIFAILFFAIFSDVLFIAGR